MKEIDQNELMSNQNKKICTTLIYTEHCLTLNCAVTGCISISAFAVLVNIFSGIMISAIGVDIFAITIRIKKYKSIIKKKKKEA